MKVKVEFVGWIRKHTKLEKHKFDIAIPKNSKVRDILTILETPHNLPQTILVNGKKVSLDTILNNGDEVLFLPMICGG